MEKEKLDAWWGLILNDEVASSMKRLFDTEIASFLSVNSYYPVDLMKIARDKKIDLKPLEEEAKERVDGDTLGVLEYESDKKQTIHIAMEEYFDEEDLEFKYMPSKKVEESRSNRFAIAYFIGMISVLDCHPLLSSQRIYNLYDDMDMIKGMLGGLPYYYACNLLMHELTIGKTLKDGDASNVSLPGVVSFVNLNPGVVDERLKDLYGENYQASKHDNIK